MAKRSGNSFGNFARSTGGDDFRLKPIRSEFGGSVPDSIYSANRESAWSRWRRGYELATALTGDNKYEYPFDYQVPLPPGVPSSNGNQPTIPGVFQGFPTTNKDFGMHWAGVRLAGSLRMDSLPNTGTPLSIASVTEDQNYWYVQIAGTWSPSNPLPPPLYVPIPGVPGGLKAINGEILEDRILTVGGAPITRDTLNPNTNTRYGYMQAVLVDVSPFTGLLTLRKLGSVQATPDRTFQTPSVIGPTPGRFLMTGTRYCCSCQDFTRRDYAFMNSLMGRKRSSFPRTSVANLKPGRYEVVTNRDGVVDNRSMTSAQENRNMTIISPAAQYNLPPTVAPNNTTVPGTNRDNPGVFSDFGSIYLRSTVDPSLPGAKAEGMPSYNDYAAVGNVITSLTDTWEPLLDEFRYCKHIYALKFKEGVFPTEPSDFPVERGSMTEWEQRLVSETEKKTSKGLEALALRSLSLMDVPPYNCQAPMMMPMMQKLFNVPTTFIRMGGFTMYDKNGNPYVPSLNERPET